MLDEKLSDSQASELQNRNVRQILLFTDPWGQGGSMSFIGLDGKAREPVKQVK